RARSVAAVVLVLGALACSSARPTTLLLTNLQLLDGTGAPARAASVRIAGDTIAAVGELARQSSDSVLDLGGLTLAPGFIDTHSHADRGLFAHPEALAAVSQGITTVVGGQDGGSPWPL